MVLIEKFQTLLMPLAGCGHAECSKTRLAVEYLVRGSLKFVERSLQHLPGNYYIQMSECSIFPGSCKLFLCILLPPGNKHLTFYYKTK